MSQVQVLPGPPFSPRPTAGLRTARGQTGVSSLDRDRSPSFAISTACFVQRGADCWPSGVTDTPDQYRGLGEPRGIDVWCNGSTWDFGSHGSGSNPDTSTKKIGIFVPNELFDMVHNTSPVVGFVLPAILGSLISHGSVKEDIQQRERNNTYFITLSRKTETSVFFFLSSLFFDIVHTYKGDAQQPSTGLRFPRARGPRPLYECPKPKWHSGRLHGICNPAPYGHEGSNPSFGSK